LSVGGPSSSLGRGLLSQLPPLAAAPDARREIWQRLSTAQRLEFLLVGYAMSWDAWTANDADTLVSGFHPDAVLDFSGFEGWLGGGPVYHGHDGVREMMRDWLTAWKAVTFETLSITAVGEQFLVHVRFTATGEGSGIEVRKDFWQVLEADGGGTRRLANYTARDDALADVGLTEAELADALAAAAASDLT
jgi:hypothetical protein